MAHCPGNVLQGVKGAGGELRAALTFSWGVLVPEQALGGTLS